MGLTKHILVPGTKGFYQNNLSGVSGVQYESRPHPSGALAQVRIRAAKISSQISSSLWPIQGLQGPAKATAVKQSAEY